MFKCLVLVFVGREPRARAAYHQASRILFERNVYFDFGVRLLRIVESPSVIE